MLPDWSGQPELLTKLDRAATKSLKKAGLTAAPYNGFNVVIRKVGSPSQALEFVVHGYSRPLTRSWFAVGLTQASEGERFEESILTLLRELAQRVGTVLTEATGVPVSIRASWTPSSGLSVADTTSGPVDLRKRARSQQQRQRALSRMAWGIAGLAVVTVTLVLIVALPGEDSFYGIFGIYPLFFLLSALIIRSMAREAELDARSLSDEADLSELVPQDEERRAQKQLQVHSNELERYSPARTAATQVHLLGRRAVYCWRLRGSSRRLRSSGRHLDRVEYRRQAHYRRTRSCLRNTRELRRRGVLTNVRSNRRVHDGVPYKTREDSPCAHR